MNEIKNFLLENHHNNILKIKHVKDNFAELCKFIFYKFFCRFDMASYSFNKILKNNPKSWSELINFNYYNKSIYYVKIFKNLLLEFFKFVSEYNYSHKCNKEYRIYHKKYCVLHNKLTDHLNSDSGFHLKNKITSETKKINFCQGLRQPSTGEKKVIQCLDDITKKCKLYYFYKFPVYFCKNINRLEYDFFCVLIQNDYIMPFVIEYDGDQHYNDVKIYNYEYCHKLDILKQYYLFRLNIHLLRINNNMNVEKSIINFINEVWKTNTYVGTNLINPIKDFFNDDSEHDGLKYFHDFFYKFNSYHKEKIRKYNSF